MTASSIFNVVEKEETCMLKDKFKNYYTIAVFILTFFVMQGIMLFFAEVSFCVSLEKIPDIIIEMLGSSFAAAAFVAIVVWNKLGSTLKD